MKFDKERNEKERTKERDKKETATATTHLPTRGREGWCPVDVAVVFKHAENFGIPRWVVEDWLHYMGEVGWCHADGNAVTANTWKRALRMWRIKQLELDERKRLRAKEKAAREKELEEKELRRREREAKRAVRQARNEADRSRYLNRKEAAFEAQEREIARRRHEEYLALKAQFGLA